jgi:hypothetical protein
MHMRGILVLEGVTMPIRRDASKGRKHIDWTPLFPDHGWRAGTKILGATSSVLLFQGLDLGLA